MNQAMPTAAERLQTVLDRENAALLAHDSLAITALLPEKSDAAAALALSIKGGSALPVIEARRLRASIEENTRLLDLALQVQSRIVGLVMRAARAADGAATGYSARGAETRAGGPLAFTTRA